MKKNRNEEGVNPSLKEKIDKIETTEKLQQDIQEHESKRKVILNYLSDRKAVLWLLFTSVIIFISVCGLYQLHNLPKIIYALILSLVAWGVYGGFDFARYFRKRKRLFIAGKYPEQASAALLGGNLPEGIPRQENDQYAAEQLSEMEKVYVGLIEDLCRRCSSLDAETEKRLGEMKDYYMMWAHQIKTPIAALKLLISDREDSFQMMEELFKIEQYAEMVLHYLRIDSMASDMLIKPKNLHELVKHTLRKYSVLFINSGLSLELEDFKVSVLTDEKWLCFVLEQIISNSIKYTKKGAISIYMKPGEEKTMVIEDSGIGIRQEDIPRIFERGFTGYNGRMDKKSTGIGLYLCRQIMNRLSHGMWAESEEGKGTRIYLELSRDSYVENAD